MTDDSCMPMFFLDMKEPLGLKARFVTEFGVLRVLGWEPGSEGDRVIQVWNAKQAPGSLLKITKDSVIVSIDGQVGISSAQQRIATWHCLQVIHCSLGSCPLAPGWNHARVALARRGRRGTLVHGSEAPDLPATPPVDACAAGVPHQGACCRCASYDDQRASDSAGGATAAS